MTAAAAAAAVAAAAAAAADVDSAAPGFSRPRLSAYISWPARLQIFVQLVLEL